MKVEKEIVKDAVKVEQEIIKDAVSCTVPIENSLSLFDSEYLHHAQLIPQLILSGGS